MNNKENNIDFLKEFINNINYAYSQSEYKTQVKLIRSILFDLMDYLYEEYDINIVTREDFKEYYASDGRNLYSTMNRFSSLISNSLEIIKDKEEIDFKFDFVCTLIEKALSTQKLTKSRNNKLFLASVIYLSKDAYKKDKLLTTEYQNLSYSIIEQFIKDDTEFTINLLDNYDTTYQMKHTDEEVRDFLVNTIIDVLEDIHFMTKKRFIRNINSIFKSEYSDYDYYLWEEVLKEIKNSENSLIKKYQMEESLK
jgi:hypothetical protein